MTYKATQASFAAAPPPLRKIDILVFKTDIRFKKELKEVGAILNVTPGIIHWNVDRADVDKILRIESINLTPGEVVHMINLAGFFCEELCD